MSKDWYKVREHGKGDRWKNVLADHPYTAAEKFCAGLPTSRVDEGTDVGILVDYKAVDYESSGTARVRAERLVSWFYSPNGGEET